MQHKNNKRRSRGNVSISRTTCFVTVFVWTLAEVVSVRLTSRPEAAHLFLRSSLGDNVFNFEKYIVPPAAGCERLEKDIGVAGDSLQIQ